MVHCFICTNLISLGNKKSIILQECEIESEEWKVLSVFTVGKLVVIVIKLMNVCSVGERHENIGKGD